MIRIIQDKLLGGFRPVRQDGAAVPLKVIMAAYQKFRAEQPRWANSLFDEWFLQRNAAVLFAKATLPTPQQLAAAWRQQFGVGSAAQKQADICHVLPIAHAFLTLVKQEGQDAISSAESAAKETATSQ